MTDPTADAYLKSIGIGGTPPPAPTHAPGDIGATATGDAPPRPRVAPVAAPAPTPQERAGPGNKPLPAGGFASVIDAKPVERPTGEMHRPNLLRTAVDMLDVPFAYQQATNPMVNTEDEGTYANLNPGDIAGPIGHAVYGIARSPKVRARVAKVTRDLMEGGPHQVSENDLALTKGWAETIMGTPNSTDSEKYIARWALANPALAGIAQGASEFANIANDLTGEALGTVGKQFVRQAEIAYPVETASMRGGVQDALHLAGAPARTAAKLTLPARMRLMAAVGRTATSALRSTPLTARLLDRYAQKGKIQAAGGEAAPSVTDRLGLPGVYAAMRGEGTAANAVNKAQTEIMPLFDGLTPEQKNEVGRLSVRNDDGTPFNEPNPDVPEPTPALPGMRARIVAKVTGKPVEATSSLSLQERADKLRDYLIDVDKRKQDRGIQIAPEEDENGNYSAGTGDVQNSNRFVPMKYRTGNPIYAGDVTKEEQRLAGLAPLSTQGPGVGINRIGQRESEHAHALPFENPQAFNDLHPQFDLGSQIENHIRESESQIANADEGARLEQMPSIDPATGQQRTQEVGGVQQPLAVRQEPHYEWQEGEGPSAVTKTGQGRAARDALDALDKRRAAAKGLQEARQSPALKAIAARVGVPVEKLGSRAVTAQSVSPYLARVREARMAQGQLGKLYGKVNPMGRFDPLAQNLERSGGRLEEALNENTRLAGEAGAQAPDLHAAAQDSERYSQQLDDAIAAAPAATQPTKKEISELARDLWNRDMQEHMGTRAEADRLIGDLKPREIKPHWIRVAGKWRPAGEWEDLMPKGSATVRGGGRSQYVDWTPPKDDAPEGEIKSNIDDVATALPGEPFGTEAGAGDDLRHFLIEHHNAPAVRAPRLSQYVDKAHAAIADEIRNSAPDELTKLLDYLGMPGKGPQEALGILRSQTLSLKAGAAKAAQEHAQRTFAERELGPAARASIATDQRTAVKVRTEAARIDGQLANVTRKQSQRIGGLGQSAARRAELTQAAVDARKIIRGFQQKAWDAQVTPLRDRAIKMPPGYSPESEMGFGHTYEMVEGQPPFGRPRNPENPPKMKARPFDYIRDSSLINFMQKQPEGVQSDINHVLRALSFIGKLQRMGIVALPFVHAFNNLGMQALQEGETPGRLAAIYSGRYVPDPEVMERLTGAGYKQGEMEKLFRMGKTGPHATTEPGLRRTIRAQKVGAAATRATGEPAIGEAASAIAKPAMAVGDAAAGAYANMNHWLFGTVQDGLAASAFERFTKPLAQGGEGMEDGPALLRVTKMIGDPSNISPLERAANLDKMFYFLPWMKTVIPFQLKHGLIDPKWWTSQVAGIRTNNELQGFDDPSQPFTATIGSKDDGTRIRAPIMTPQRVLGDAADAVRIAPDIAEGVSGNKRGYLHALQDALAPVNYLSGHLVAPLQFADQARQAAMAAGSSEGLQALPPWNPFAPPKGEKFPNAGSIAGNMASEAFPPIEKARQIGDVLQGGDIGDYLKQLPIDAGMSLFGSTPYERPAAADPIQALIKRRLQAPFRPMNALLRREITQAEQSGDWDTAAQLQQQLDAAGATP